MKNCFLLTLIVFCTTISWSQVTNYQGKVVDKSGKPLEKVLIFQGYKKLATTNNKGIYNLTSQQFQKEKSLEFFLENYQLQELELPKKTVDGKIETVILQPLEFDLSEVVIKKQIAKASALRTLKDLEGTTTSVLMCWAILKVITRHRLRRYRKFK